MAEIKVREKPELEKENNSEDENHGSFGWFNFKPKCLQFLNSPVSLLVVMSAYFFSNSTVINGIYSTSISTIEKRFNLSSSQMGLVTSMYDVAALLVTGPVSYFGTRRKSRYLGVGMLMMAFSYFVFILPHFMETPYQPVINTLKSSSNATSNVLCNGTSNQKLPSGSYSKHGSDLYYGIFLLAMFIAGASCTPMLTLGIPYIDESVSPRKSPIYLGIMQSWSVIAAVVGFVLAGAFLGIFVHPGADVQITPKNRESWIGAWWLGFAVFAVFALVVGIFMLGFPARVKSKDKEVKKKLKDVPPKLSRGDLLDSVKALFLHNPTFLCISMVVSIENFIFSAGGAFAPKMTILQYRLDPSRVGFYFGIIAFGATIGLLTGSYAIRKLELTTSGALKMAAIMTSLSLITICNAFMFCENPPIAGIHQSRLPSLGCNENCRCPSDLYLPVCGHDGMTYISPCHAGCKGLSSARTFSNCSCSYGQNTKNNEVKLGFCQSDCGVFPYLYFVFGFINSVLVCTAIIPCTICTMRCVPFELRSFAIGVQWTMVRLIGAIPGPILVGYVIDQYCVHWFTSGSSERSCRIYDNKKLAISVATLMLSLRATTALFLTLASIFERRKKKTENTDAASIDTYL